MKKIIFAVFSVFTLLQTTAAMAGEKPYLTIGAGAFDALDSRSIGEFRAEYRAKNIWHSLYPFLGVSVNSDRGIFASVGANYDVFVTNNIVLTPNAAVGYYIENDSRDLGGPIEFRTGLELAYQFEDASRLGLNVSHISNAGIYEDNPGSESILVTYSIPLSF